MGHSSISVASGSREFAVDRHVRAKKRLENVQRRLEEVFDDNENVDSIAEEHVTSQNDNVMNKKSIKIQTEQDNSFPSQTWFKENDERVRFYTGLPTMAVLIAVLDLIRPGLPERKSLDKFQQLLITLMRLRLNLCVQDTIVDTMFVAMKFLVRWPTRGTEIDFAYYLQKQVLFMCSHYRLFQDFYRASFVLTCQAPNMVVI